MTRIIDRKITVEVGSGQLIAFTFRKQHGIAAILDRWIEAGAWWDQDCDREMFRVLTDDDGVYELERATATGNWRLYKVWD